LFKKLLMTLVIFFFSFSAFAWDATGHKLVAQIAWQNLTPKTKAFIKRYTRAFPKHCSEYKCFLAMSVWPDQIKSKNINVFDHWHFISQGFTDDHFHVPPTQPYNVVWAIPQMQMIMTSSKAPTQAKTLALSFFIHFIGDIHQPLHCISLFNKKYPQGDQGGNLILIRSPYATELHSLWDQGVGSFYIYSKHYPLPITGIQKLAAQIMKTYPQKSFGEKVINYDPQQWAQDSFQLAKTNAYPMKTNAIPSKQYIKHNRVIALKQVALAGYRLAYLLNAWANGSLVSPSYQ